MVKHFNWQKDFDRIYNTSGPKLIRKCLICGDLSYLAVADLPKYKFKKIENAEEYICPTCWQQHYITTKEAEKIDAIYNTEYSLGEQSVETEPFLIGRDQYTWDEAQTLNKEYKEALKQYLEGKDPEFLQQYMNLFK